MSPLYRTGGRPTSGRWRSHQVRQSAVSARTSRSVSRLSSALDLGHVDKRQGAAGVVAELLDDGPGRQGPCQAASSVRGVRLHPPPVVQPQPYPARERRIGIDRVADSRGQGQAPGPGQALGCLGVEADLPVEQGRGHGVRQAELRIVRAAKSSDAAKPARRRARVTPRLRLARVARRCRRARGCAARSPRGRPAPAPPPPRPFPPRSSPAPVARARGRPRAAYATSSA